MLRRSKCRNRSCTSERKDLAKYFSLWETYIVQAWLATSLHPHPFLLPPVQWTGWTKCDAGQDAFTEREAGEPRQNESSGPAFRFPGYRYAPKSHRQFLPNEPISRPLALAESEWPAPRLRGYPQVGDSQHPTLSGSTPLNPALSGSIRVNPAIEILPSHLLCPFYESN